jgi:subfamily B ATP-binding cassette protein MsbA
MKSFFLKSQFIRNYSRMWPFVKPYWFRALLGVLLTIPVGAFDAVIAGFLRPIMDNVMVEKQQDFSQKLPLLIVAFTLLQGTFIYLSTYVNTWVGTKISQGIKRKLFDKLLSMDSSYFEQNNSGMIIFRYSNDADLAAAGLINNLKLFLSKFFSSLGLLGVMLYNSWSLTLVSVAVLGLAVYPLQKVKKKIKDVTTKTVGAGSHILTVYNETFNGNKIIHSYTLEKKFRQKFNETLDFIFRLSIKMVQGSGWLSPLLHFIGSIGVALVVGYGTYQIISGQITPGAFVAFLAALIMLYTPLKSIGSNFVSMQMSFLAIERIFELFEEVPKISSNDGHRELTGIKKGISFDKVHFRYTKDTEVLHGISFDIKTGQTVALVGNSGGGKTTIASLIPRLYEIEKGNIRIDGISIQEYTLESLRRNIAVVFQDNYLFMGSVKENILLGKEDATEDEIWDALKKANLDEFVRGLPNKLETEIGERGVLLSGGQKQRMAIARAFIKDAPLVILDEATSALDNKAEKVVQQALDKLMENRTVIVIAHRLSTVQNASKILVINDGYIVEEGTHQELLDAEGAYYALYSLQFKSKEKEEENDEEQS